MVAAAPCASRRSFRDSLKVLEADIQHANTQSTAQIEESPFLNFVQVWGVCCSPCREFVSDALPLCRRASECSRDYDRACLQMRMSYCPAVRIFLFLMQWTNSSLAGALGLLRILLSVYVDGTTTMSTH